MSRASRRPSAVAAVRMRHHMLCRRVVTIDSDTRFWIRTGRPALRASATVSGSILVYDFEPKPPPRYGTWMRTFATGTPKQVGDLGTDEERVLAGGPESDFVALVLGDHGVRLHRVLVDRRELVLALDDDVRAGEDRLELPTVDAVAVADVPVTRRESPRP